MSSQAIIRIIESSAKSGVSELQFGGLHVKFGTPPEQVGTSAYPFMPQAAAQPPVAALTAQHHNQVAQEALEAEQIRLREEQLSLAMIEDPVKFERMMRDGELSDGMDGADEDDDID